MTGDRQVSDLKTVTGAGFKPAPRSERIISFRLRRNQSGVVRSKAELINTQPLDAKLERRGRKPQRFRRPVRPRNAAVRSAQGRLDGLALLCLKPFVDISNRGAAWQCVSLHAQCAVARKNHGPLDHVFQLAHVTRPVVRRQQIHRATVDPADRPTEPLAVFGGEVRGQQRNIFDAFPQRRQMDGEDIQPVVEIAAESARPHVIGQIPIGRRHDPHVYAHGLAAAQPFELALLQDAQQHYLHLGRQLSDLVQKERAAVSLLEPPFATRHGAGESAALVTEQFRSQQGVRNGGAVEFDQRPARARRKAMNRARDQFLARPGLASDQDCRVSRRDLLDAVQRAAYRRRIAHDLVELLAPAQLLTQHYVFLLQLVAQFANLLVGQRIRHGHGQRSRYDLKDRQIAVSKSFRLYAAEGGHANQLFTDNHRDRGVSANAAGGQAKLMLIPGFLRKQIVASIWRAVHLKLYIHRLVRHQWANRRLDLTNEIGTAKIFLQCFSFTARETDDVRRIAIVIRAVERNDRDAVIGNDRIQNLGDGFEHAL